jgi:hypothetical protein
LCWILVTTWTWSAYGKRTLTPKYETINMYIS